MPALVSPLAVLGLSPGASRAEIDEAYRRLIKQHHPDRAGGDPRLAAELNWAYGILKREGAGEEGQRRATVNAPPTVRESRTKKFVAAGTLLAAGGALLLLPMPSIPLEQRPPAAAPVRPGSAARSPGPQDISTFRAFPESAAVTSGVAEAVRLSREGTAEQAARYSRSCADDLRRYPGAALLDHCVAFDTAATSLMAGVGASPFFTPELMALRHAEAAAVLSADPVLAQARVDVVRREAQRLALGISETDPGR